MGVLVKGVFGFGQVWSETAMENLPQLALTAFSDTPPNRRINFGHITSYVVLPVWAAICPIMQRHSPDELT
jgi:hypothetical protein